jgi:hypothetical protein
VNVCFITEQLRKGHNCSKMKPLFELHLNELCFQCRTAYLFVTVPTHLYHCIVCGFNYKKCLLWIKERYYNFFLCPACQVESLHSFHLFILWREFVSYQVFENCSICFTYSVVISLCFPLVYTTAKNAKSELKVFIGNCVVIKWLQRNYYCQRNFKPFWG